MRRRRRKREFVEIDSEENEKLEEEVMAEEILTIFIYFFYPLRVEAQEWLQYPTTTYPHRKPIIPETVDIHKPILQHPSTSLSLTHLSVHRFHKDSCCAGCLNHTLRRYQFDPHLQI